LFFSELSCIFVEETRGNSCETAMEPLPPSTSPILITETAKAVHTKATKGGPGTLLIPPHLGQRSRSRSFGEPAQPGIQCRDEHNWLWGLQRQQPNLWLCHALEWHTNHTKRCTRGTFPRSVRFRCAEFAQFRWRC